METMDQPRRKQAKITHLDSEEISSIEWEFISMTAQEVDLIHRMHKLVGDRWDLIAGRVPGRKEEEIERVKWQNMTVSSSPANYPAGSVCPAGKIARLAASDRDLVVDELFLLP